MGVAGFDSGVKSPEIILNPDPSPRSRQTPSPCKQHALQIEHVPLIMYVNPKPEPLELSPTKGIAGLKSFFPKVKGFFSLWWSFEEHRMAEIEL